MAQNDGFGQYRTFPASAVPPHLQPGYMAGYTPNNGNPRGAYNMPGYRMGGMAPDPNRAFDRRDFYGPRRNRAFNSITGMPPRIPPGPMGGPSPAPMGDPNAEPPMDTTSRLKPLQIPSNGGGSIHAQSVPASQPFNPSGNQNFMQQLQEMMRNLNMGRSSYNFNNQGGGNPNYFGGQSPGAGRYRPPIMDRSGNWRDNAPYNYNLPNAFGSYPGYGQGNPRSGFGGLGYSNYFPRDDFEFAY